MKRKVLFVMDGMKIGGVENALISVLNRFDYEQFDVDLLLLHDHLELLDKVNPKVKVYHYDKLSAIVKDFSFWLWYGLFSLTRLFHIEKGKRFFSSKMQHHVMSNRCKKLLPEKYDTVIAYKQGEAENCVAFCIPAGQKVVFYHHGSIIDDDLHKATFSHFDRIVAVSNGVEQMLREQYPQFADKMMTIPNYVDSETILEKAREYVPNVDKSKKNICSVGRLCEEKRFDRAIEAAAILKQNGMPFCWYIIGDGELREPLEQKIKEISLEEQVVMTGSMKNPMPYVSACDVYVQTSDAESYGLAIQEALVLGKPVVSTKTIGGRLLLQEQGQLVDDSPDEIASAIKKTIEQVTLQFHCNKMCNDDVRIYEKWKTLLGERNYV